MKNQKIIISIICIIVLSTFIFSKDASPIKVQKISENLSVFSGIGGNIAVLKGDGKLLVIDAGVVQAGDLLKNTIKKHFNLPVEILINTHYHQDHTGGNKAIADGKTIISHKNCQNTMQKMAKSASRTEKGKKTLKNVLLPNKIYEGQKEIKFGDETILLLNFGPGHTNGDTVVIFKKNKVVHAADLFFFNIAPYIDVRDNCNTENWIKTIKKLSNKFSNYKVIPGHGEVTDMKGFLGFSKYLQHLRDSIKKGIKNKKTIEEIMESTSFENFPRVKEINSFMSKKNNLKWVYQEMTRTKK